MNNIYISKFRHALMFNLINETQLMTDEGCSPKLVLNKGGGTKKIES